MRALPLSPRLMSWLPLALTPAYLLLVWALAPLLGPAVGIPSLLWAPAGAFLFGLRGGLILAVGALIAHELVFHVLKEAPTAYSVTQDLIGHGVMFLLVGASGWLRALLWRLRRLEAAVHSTQEGLAVTDLELGESGPRLQFANASFLRDTALSPGTPALARYAAQIDSSWRQELRRALETGQPFVRQLTLPPTATLGERVMELSIDPIRDRAGRATQLVLAQRDVTAYKQLEARLGHQAEHDPLTGLPNRAAFESHLHCRTTRSPGAPFAVLLLDLDGFKSVNDTLGHDVGDALLVQVADRLRHALRPEDLVARLGGDEFVVVTAPLGQEADARYVADRLLGAFHDPFRVAGHHLVVRTSVGISGWPADGPDGAGLLKRADVAMYAAKQGGRNGVRFFVPAMSAAAEERSTLEGRLRTALETGGFSLHYQPIVPRATGPLVFEALMRWTDPVLGAVPPGRFIPVAEDAGLMVPLGAWVLEEACRQARIWQDAGHTGRRVSVNISPLQFDRPDFVGEVLAALGRHQLSPGCLILELTERLLVRDLDAARQTVAALRALGLELWIDDFGAGDAALKYLLVLPVSGVKIDRAFVQALDDPQGRRLVQAVVALAQALELDVIAEGIETEPQRAALHELGCGWLQGFLLGRPAAPDAEPQSTGPVLPEPLRRLGSGSGAARSAPRPTTSR